MKIISNAEYLEKVRKHKAQAQLLESSRQEDIATQELRERCAAARQFAFDLNSEKGRELRAKVMSKKLTRWIK